MRDVDEEPRGEMKFEAYFGMEIVTPLAHCSGCGKMMAYRRATGRVVMETACPCTESD